MFSLLQMFAYSEISFISIDLAQVHYYYSMSYH